jgi:hypothetical protein
MPEASERLQEGASVRAGKRIPAQGTKRGDFMICICCKKTKHEDLFYIGASGKPRNTCKLCYSSKVSTRKKLVREEKKAARLAEFNRIAQGYGKNGQKQG